MDNLWIIYGSGWWLSPTPLKNMSSSIRMSISNIWKIQNVPNHQPVIVVILVTYLFCSELRCLLKLFQGGRWVSFIQKGFPCSRTAAKELMKCCNARLTSAYEPINPQEILLPSKSYLAGKLFSNGRLSDSRTWYSSHEKIPTCCHLRS